MPQKKKTIPAPATDPTGIPAVVRLTASERERLAALSDAMAARIAGVPVPVGSLVHSIIEKGLDQLETELGIRRK